MEIKLFFQIYPASKERGLSEFLEISTRTCMTKELV